MADYIVKDTELTSVANAIRTAGGTNSLLNFPNGFVSAVGNISGGGSSDFSTAEVTLANNLLFAGGVPICASDGGMEGITVNQLGDGTYTVPLWKGHLYLVLQDITATVSGDAALIYGGMAVDVYGDCTITKVS